VYTGHNKRKLTKDMNGNSQKANTKLVRHYHVPHKQAMPPVPLPI
jgi:hypothetical protein